MMLSSKGLEGTFKIIFNERYRDPTLQLIVPVMIATNVFFPAFLAQGGFKPFALVLAGIPVINVSETLAFALALRNIIFVLGDHIFNNSIVSFLMMPVRRTQLFLIFLLNDIGIPYIIWVFTTLFYLVSLGVNLSGVVLAIIEVFSAGYLFSVSFILMATLKIRSPGATALVSVFVLGSLFIFGGLGGYELILSRNVFGEYVTSAMNPYVSLLGYYVTGNGSLLSVSSFGSLIDLALGIIFIIISLIIFKRYQV